MNPVHVITKTSIHAFNNSLQGTEGLVKNIRIQRYWGKESRGLVEKFGHFESPEKQRTGETLGCEVLLKGTFVKDFLSYIIQKIGLKVSIYN